MSLHSRSLSTSPGIAQLADLAMDSHFLDIDTIQLVQIPPVDLPGFGLCSSEILLAPDSRGEMNIGSFHIDVFRDNVKLDRAIIAYVQP